MTDDPAGQLLSLPPPRLDAVALADLAFRYWGLKGSLIPLSSERDQNHRLDADGQSFTLKLANPAEPPELTRFQTVALLHVAKTDPGLAIPRVLLALDGRPIIPLAEGALRLLSWCPGTPLARLPLSPGLAGTIGDGLARLTQALSAFDHPGADHVLLWDIKQFARLSPLLVALPPDLRAEVGGFLQHFETSVAPCLAGLPAQVVHSDFNLHNLLADPADPSRLTGILDFGDMVRTYRVCDLAVSAAYLVDPTDPLALLLPLVAAYHARLPLLPEEIALLPDLIRARMLTSLTISTWRAARYPENADYILRNAPSARAGLAALAGLRPADLTDAFFEACERPLRMTRDRMPNAFSPGADLAPEDQARIDRRARLLGPAYRLFYDEPLHLVRGEGVWLYDRNGRAYLDAYNNVASVGHCHPRVTAAMAGQAATLATHTRYLHDGILDYAERLLALFPPPLSHVMFTCTGSEANDLALRIARAATGGTGIIVTDNAYHGVTLSTAEASLSLGSATAPGPTVFPIPAPSVANYPAGIATGFAAAVTAACSQMASQGVKPAALLTDTIFSSDGVLPDPAGFLKPAATAIRAHGGLFIADEVQAGFGRTGTHMWGFERHGVIPDMVSLGKPMGNGYPMAGLVVQPEILAAFGTKTRYFNTFGGNAVAAAVGLAVLDVIRDEGLQSNAAKVGTAFATGLRDLATRHSALGETRAAGLYLGQDILKDGAPDAARAGSIVNELRRHGILISATGPNGHVLKIRPPLPFSQSNVDQALTTLDRVLAKA